VRDVIMLGGMLFNLRRERLVFIACHAFRRLQREKAGKKRKPDREGKIDLRHTAMGDVRGQIDAGVVKGLAALY